MPFPAGSLGIVPYMNFRETFVPDFQTPSPAIQNWLDNTASFPINTDIVFRWLEDGNRPLVPNNLHSYCFNIYANGKYGTDALVANHFPWVHITPALPNIANLNSIRQLWLLQDFGGIYTVTNRSELQQLSSGTHPTLGGLDFTTNSTIQAQPGTPANKFNWQTGVDIYRFHSYVFVSSENTWWVYTRYGALHQCWVRAIPKVSAGPTTAFNGTSCTIYTATTPSGDLPKYQNRIIRENDYYELCYDINGLHATYLDQNGNFVYLFDAILRILPAGRPIYKQYPDRTELNTRVAGEKALYEDEFLTAGQVEAGVGIVLRWRNLAGDVPVDPNNSYGVVPAAAGNLIIESTATGSGNTRHQGAYYPFNQGNLYYDETTSIIRFQDEPQDYPDSMVAIPKTTLPIYFDLFHDVVNDVGIVRARAANNNLHFSKSEFVPPSSYINHYPMYDAGFTDFTVNHIRFVDTANLTWNVFGDTIPTLLPPGNTTGIRQGVVIEPQLNGLYVNWNVKSGKPDIYNSRRQQTAYNDNGLNVNYTVDSLDTVEFFGKNGVVCTLEGLFANQLRVMIDRRLSVQSSNNKQQIGDNTTRIEFRSFLGEDSILLFPFASGDDSNLQDTRYSLSYFSSNINPGGSHFRTPVLPVTFTVNSSPGINEDDMRIVRGWYPKQIRRWASQWSKDYDNTNTDSYRILSNNPANQILPIGFWGWGSTSDGNSVYTPAAGSEWNMLAGDSQAAPWYNFRYSDWNVAYPGGPQEMPIGLQMPWEDGIYFIQATVQGIMGIQASVQPGQMNPVISQAVHFYLVTAPDISVGNGENFQARTLQSLDIMRDYDYVAPTVQAQTGYMQAVNSRPWSMQGSGMFYLKQRERVFGLLTYNPGNGESRFYYQVCYVKMSCFKVSTAADMKLGSITIDADGDPTMYNYAPQRWHDMNFY